MALYAEHAPALALDAIRDKAVGANGAIDRVSQSLTAKQESLADQLEKIERKCRTIGAK